MDRAVQCCFKLNETSYLPKPQKSDQPSENGKEPIIVQSITVDAVGQPGARDFLFASHIGEKMRLCQILLEKTQAVILADQIDGLLRQLAESYPELSAAPDAQTPLLIPPEKTLFRAGNIVLQYKTRLIWLSCT